MSLYTRDVVLSSLAKEALTTSTPTSTISLGSDSTRATNQKECELSGEALQIILTALLVSSQTITHVCRD